MGAQDACNAGGVLQEGAILHCITESRALVSLEVLRGHSNEVLVDLLRELSPVIHEMRLTHGLKRILESRIRVRDVAKVRAIPLGLEVLSSLIESLDGRGPINGLVEVRVRPHIGAELLGPQASKGFACCYAGIGAEDVGQQALLDRLGIVTVRLLKGFGALCSTLLCFLFLKPFCNFPSSGLSSFKEPASSPRAERSGLTGLT